MNRRASQSDPGCWEKDDLPDYDTHGDGTEPEALFDELIWVAEEAVF